MAQESKIRTITRRLTVPVAFHHVDMMHVVHNSQYFKWFERGRLVILEEIFPLTWAVENQIVPMVVTNHCDYLAPATYGERLVVTTRHRIQTQWRGRLRFDHSISNIKTKVELCSGMTEVTVFDLKANALIKELPELIWNRYLQLS